MWLKYPTIILSFLILALLQQSFFVHFNLFGIVPNLIFMLFFILLFFENPKQYSVGYFCIITAGFFLDIFTSSYFGTAILSLLITYGVFKIAIEFLKEIQGKYLMAYFIPMFVFFLALYNVLFYIVANFPHITLTIPPNLFIGLAYNLTVALVMFFLYKSVTVGHYHNRQLTLFR